MPARQKYHMAERVKELLENWARWPGWESGGSSRSTLAWLADFVGNKRVGDYQTSIPVMGGEAADTHYALGRMNAELREVLVLHYTERGHVNDKIARVNLHRAAARRISRATFFRHLDTAHHEFMAGFEGARHANARIGAANEAVAVHASEAVARRWRLRVTAKLPKSAPKSDDDSGR